MEKNKENVLYDFEEMIEKSWTYGKMTETERKNWKDVLYSVRTKNALKGTYIQRWEILQAIYGAYLIGIGYDNFNWREDTESTLF